MLEPAVGTRMFEPCAQTEVKKSAADERRAKDSFILLVEIVEYSKASRLQCPTFIPLQGPAHGVSWPLSMVISVPRGTMRPFMDVKWRDK